MSKQKRKKNRDTINLNDIKPYRNNMKNSTNSEIDLDSIKSLNSCDNKVDFDIMQSTEELRRCIQERSKRVSAVKSKRDRFTDLPQTIMFSSVIVILISIIITSILNIERIYRYL